MFIIDNGVWRLHEREEDRDHDGYICQMCYRKTNTAHRVRFPSSRLYTYERENAKSWSFRTYLMSYSVCSSCYAKYIAKDGFECICCHDFESPKFWVPSVGSKLQEQQLCHTCNYWHEKIAIKDSPKSIRINGQQYIVENDDPSPGWGSGFGGRIFNIKMKDGRIIRTRNLWSNSFIPERFRHLLPDNAEFLPDDPDMKEPRWEGFVDRNNPTRNSPHGS